MDGNQIKLIKIGTDVVSIFTGYNEFIGYKGPNLSYIDSELAAWYSIDEAKLLEFAEKYREQLDLDEKIYGLKSVVSKKKVI